MGVGEMYLVLKKSKKPQKCDLRKGDETNRRTRDESQ